LPANDNARLPSTQTEAAASLMHFFSWLLPRGWPPSKYECTGLRHGSPPMTVPFSAMAENGSEQAKEIFDKL
jgi:hypothetical protein